MWISKRILTAVTLLYIYIPVILFLCGWTNIIVNLITLTAIGISFRQMYVFEKQNEEYQSIKIDAVVLVFALAFFSFIGFYAGWGRWVDQSGDWLKHNAILYDLTKREWPVYYTNGTENSMLVYYIGQYMVPAFVGKITGSTRIAEIMFFVWNELGLFLVYLNILFVVNAKKAKSQFITAFVLPLFGIPLWISEHIFNCITGTVRPYDYMWFYISDGILLQYSDNFTLLRWVVPQVICCWLIVELFLENKDRVEIYVLLILPGIFFGTLSFLGLLPIVGLYALVSLIVSNNKAAFLKRVFSISNIILAFTLGTIMALYFYGNVMGEKPDSISFVVQPYGNKWNIYLTFVIVNILIYAAMLFSENKRNCVFYAVIFELTVLPLFKMGQWNDLVMRVSIPGLFLLMIFILRFVIRLSDEGENELSIWRKISGIIVVLFIFVSMYNSMTELSESCQSYDPSRLGNGNGWETMEKFANRSLDETDDVKYNYYAYDIEDNLFYKLIAK